MLWQNLYFYSDSAIDLTTIEQIIQADLLEAGYERYNPFDLIPGKAYNEQIRLFLAPQSDGWVRILGDGDERFAAALSRHGFVLLCILDETQLDLSTWQDGETLQLDESLQHFRQAHCTEDDLTHAIKRISDPHKLAKQDDVLPMGALSEGMQEMARGLGKWRKKLIFNQLMKHVNKQFSGDEEAARDLLKNREPDWNGELGLRLAAIMDCLIIADNWRNPDFGTLRDAYQLHVHCERFPNAAALPGDEQTMRAVPNALDYVPVYAGRD